VGHFCHVYALHVRVGQRLMDTLAQRQIGSSCGGSNPLRPAIRLAAHTASISCAQGAINGETQAVEPLSRRLHESGAGCAPLATIAATVSRRRPVLKPSANHVSR
jgi:hypothetical protein